MTEPMTLEREAFEKWYAESAFNYGRDPIGSRECGLQWAAWNARAHLAQQAQVVGAAIAEIYTEGSRTQLVQWLDGVHDLGDGTRLLYASAFPPAPDKE